MNQKNHNNYVCPVCFQKIESCNCISIPYSLIMIDEKIQWAIQELNNKHIITQSCCAGHYIPNKMTCIYITFQNKPKTKPLGWSIRGNGIYYLCFPKNQNEFESICQKQYNHLKHWIK